MDNPLSVPYFTATAGRVGLALGGLLLVALLRDRHAKVAPGPGRMTTKVLTAAGLAAILLATLFVGGAPFCLLVGLVMTLALREFAALAGLPLRYQRVLYAQALGTLVAVAVHPSLPLMLPLALSFLVVTAVPILSGDVSDALRHSGSTVFGFLYIGLGLSAALLIREGEPWGLRFLVVAGTGVAFADAGGYLVGTRVGGPLLAPTISPNKTWSGVAGAALGATVGVLGQSPVMPGSWSHLVVGGVIVAVAIGAVWGDLVESYIKRAVGEKDAGAMLPGFGGILDRFDSYLVAIPAAYVVVLGLWGGAG